MMHRESIQALLEAVRDGSVSLEHAVEKLRRLPYETLDSARIDHHRSIRCGFPEVIFGEGKTIDQLANIFSRLAESSDRVLATRCSAEQFAAVAKMVPGAQFHETARCITLQPAAANLSSGTILLVTAGTSDLPVLEEARVTCEIMEQRTQTLTDVGVAGIHRLLSNVETLQSARVIIAVAGMDGAMPGVVSGLVQAPVIAVPTSVGYGAAFEGVAPLLTMLNACAPGVSVVNIDSGFSAGYLAAMINRIGEQNAAPVSD